jgi:hypothetical protein
MGALETTHGKLTGSADYAELRRPPQDKVACQCLRRRQDIGFLRAVTYM